LSNIFAHYRILSFPGDQNPVGGLLDSLQLERHQDRLDVGFEYHAFELTGPSRLFEREGRVWEKLEGQYVPRWMRFEDVEIKEGERIPELLQALPRRHPDRQIYATLAWRTLEGTKLFLFELYAEKNDSFLFQTRKCVWEQASGESWKAELERDWSPPPKSTARQVPSPWRLWKQYGGDPVKVRLNGRDQPLRLFVGGLDIQFTWRPQVGAVLNLGDQPSAWCRETSPCPGDRWAQKGEGRRGMTAGDLADEAGWVIDRLKQGQRVLVHCSAGMNRSASVCCAVLILLEGLSAEAALERVREHHPWARPDPRHWLALRWLAESTNKKD
jgi:hypothetical protein